MQEIKQNISQFLVPFDARGSRMKTAISIGNLSVIAYYIHDECSFSKRSHSLSYKTDNLSNNSWSRNHYYYNCK